VAAQSRLKVVCALLLVVGLLAGCVGSGAPQNPTAEPSTQAWDAKPIELRVMCASCLEPGTDKAQETYQKAFMELHPNVKIVLEGVPSEQFHQKLVTLGTGGQLPDLIEDQNAFVSANAEAGFTLPLNDFADQSFFDEFLPGSIDMLSYKGKVYALQIGMVNTGIIYRADLLKEAGLEEPPMDWTWEDFARYAVALTKGDQYGLGVSGKASRGNFTTLLPYIYANGGTIVEQTPDGKWIASVNSPEAVEALAFLGDLVHKYKVMSPSFLTNGFSENVRDMALGRLAMFETASHAFGIIAVDYPDVVQHLRSRPFPGHVPFSRGWAAGWSVCKTGDPVKQRAAWEYVKFMTNRENQILWNELTWWMPTRKNAYDAPKLTAPQYEGFSKAAEHIVQYPNLPVQAKIEDLVMDVVQGVFTGKTDYQAMMDDLAQKINAVLDEAELLGKK